MNKRLFTGVFFLVLLVFMAGQSYACPILKAIIGSSDVRPAKPTWVYVGGRASFVGCQSVGSIVNCTWSLQGSSDILYNTHVYPNDHVSCKFGAVGTCTVTLTVRDSQGRTDTDTCTVYVVSIGIGTNESTYVAVNNDDDNENGIMDMCEDGTVSNEDTQPYDLRKILLSVNTPKLDDKVKLVASPDGGEPRIQVWSYRNKGSRIIPRSVPNEPDKYYVEWPSGTVPSELYVEAASYASAPGNHPYVALGYIGVNRNTTPPTEELVFGDPPAPVNFTFLEVDVDIDGVQDDYYTYWKFTDETIPGGFIPLNGLVKINLMSLAPSDLPINASAPVTLKAISGGDKIRIWDNENKTGTPITLPKTYTSRWTDPIHLWVEGIELSSIPRDITLALEYTGFEDRIRMTVYCITVTWETYMDNIPIDQHPVIPPNGGKRIFPDKKSYDDTNAADRKKVRVKATITPAVDNRKIYFKGWDVDDPSTNPIIDTYDCPSGPSGPDNYGTGASLSSSDAITDGSGEARVTLTVSMNPGDNFKIAASLDGSEFNPLNPGAMKQEMADGLEPLPASVFMSEMLTVWRKLHIELDSMAEVAATGPEMNRVIGTADSYNYDAGENKTTADLGQDLAACWEETKEFHFENGSYTPSGGSSYTPFKTISHWGDDELVVFGNCSSESKVYVLLDEDNQNILPKLPDTIKTNSIFDDCYILCVSDAPGSTQDVPFQRNLGGASTSGSDISNAARRDSATYEADGYWVVYVLSIFQLGYSQDKDPNTDPGQAGVTEDSWQASVIPLENIRDAAACYGHNATTLEQQAAAHEIGHQVLKEGDSAHRPDTIMQAGLPVAAQYEKFSPEHIAKIRSQTSSPGE